MNIRAMARSLAEGCLVITAVQGLKSSLDYSDIEANTHMEQNIAQLRGQLSADKFDSLAKVVDQDWLWGYAANSAKTPLNWKTAADAFKDAPKDSIDVILNRTITALKALK